MSSTELETPPVWMWDAPLEPIRAAHSGHTSADVLIVGGGLAGVATAYYLATQAPGLRIVIAEATQVGFGATGRSTGIVGPGLSAPLRSMRRRYGDAVTAGAFASTLRGAAEVRRLVDAAGVGCDARVEQHVVAALTAGQERRMRAHAADLARLGFPIRWWDETAVRDRLAGAYRCAFAYDDVVLVDPYRLVTGLARAAEALGVEIRERTRVRRLERGPGGVRAHTDGGVIGAQRVLLAVDGYADGLNPHRSSVLPVRTHVVATAPLTVEQREGLGWDGIGGVIDQRNFFDYFRLGAGGRLIFGGGQALYPTGDPRRDARGSSRVFAQVEERLRARFPALRDIPIQARWSGLTGGTLDRLPVVGPVEAHPGVHFAGGWCGHGLAMCVDTAERYASVLATGAAPDDQRLPWFRTATTGLPSASLRSLALPAYLRAMDWQDRVAIARSSDRSQPLQVRIPR
jgi:glycine/D-amino acid oxidase-like deaminating enzyme